MINHDTEIFFRLENGFAYQGIQYKFIIMHNYDGREFKSKHLLSIYDFLNYKMQYVNMG